MPLIFRAPFGTVHHCPKCGGLAAIQHWELPVFAHRCETTTDILYWTPSQVFPDLLALSQYLATV